MSWRQTVGKFANYIAKNYQSRIPHNFCQKSLNNEIESILNNPKTITSVIKGKEISSHLEYQQLSPGYGKKAIVNYGYLPSQHYEDLHTFSMAKDHWTRLALENKFNIFEKIADLVENKYYYKMMAATMVGQGKNLVEAELDCIAETVDFLRFNIQYAKEIYQKQPIGNGNISQYLPVQGRFTAITPFNFTAIAANLSTAPLYFGNVVYWKPSEKSLLSNKLFFDICIEAGLPPEIINFVLMNPNDYVNEVVRNQTGGILFTGSTDVFTKILGRINYKKHFPRIIGETGGKNFHFVEKTSNIEYVVEKTYQAAYGYAGQKCSACSVIYLPNEMEDDFLEKFKDYHAIHHPSEKDHYCVIGEDSFKRTKKVIDTIEKSDSLDILMGGNYDDSENYYVEPTLIKVNKCNELMTKEFFAPILFLKTYDSKMNYFAIEECANLSDYKLTGAIFSEDNDFINYASYKFQDSCGNFYINDKCTGSVVGQQPFGGFGKSGTNDKAGDINFMMRLFNQRNIKRVSK